MPPVRAPTPKCRTQNRKRRASSREPKKPARNVPECEKRVRRFCDSILFWVQFQTQRFPGVHALVPCSCAQVPGISTLGKNRPAETRPAPPRPAQISRSIPSFESEPPPQLVLDSIHLSIIALVIIPHQVQNSVEHQDAQFVLQATAVCLCIPARCFGGDRNIAKNCRFGSPMSCPFAMTSSRRFAMRNQAHI